MRVRVEVGSQGHHHPTVDHVSGGKEGLRKIRQLIMALSGWGYGISPDFKDEDECATSHLTGGLFSRRI